MVGDILLVIFYLAAPAGVLWLCRKVRFLGVIGPILLLYLVGIILGNLPWVPPHRAQIQEIVTSAMIPLAIPMLLFNCSFNRSLLKTQFKALIGGILAVTIAIVAGFMIFGSHLGPEGPKMGGMATGVYLGGTVNMAAIQMILDAKYETYILMNSYDLVISAVYMGVLLGGGIRLFRWFLPVDKSLISEEARREISEEERKNKNINPYAGFFRRANFSQVLKAGALTLAIAAVSGGIALLVPKEYFMLVMILLLTTGGVVASLFGRVKKLTKSYDAGMYLIYIFSIAVASMADFSKLNLSEGAYLALFMTFAVFVSLILQGLISKILKVDGDSTVIASVAMINSAPFVPMIAAAMGNRDALVTGITIGLAGYAIGNYFGVLIYQLLTVL